MFLSLVTLFTVSMLTSCADAGDADSAVVSLSLSTSSLVFDFDGAPSDDNNGQVSITANRDWEISIPATDASWLSVDYSSGSSTKTVTFTAGASAESRYSTVTIAIYSSGYLYASEELKISQGEELDSNSILSASMAANVGEEYTDLEGTVVAVSNLSYVLEDNTGAILVYAKGAPFEIGDVVTISGTTTSYGGLGQFSTSDESSIATKTGTTEVDFSSPTVMTAADLEAYADNLSVKYVKYTGTLTATDDGYTNITVDGCSETCSISYAPSGLYDSSLDGQVVDVYGYMVGDNGYYLQTVGVCIVAEGADFELPDLWAEEDVDFDSLSKFDLTGQIEALDFMYDIESPNAVNAQDAIFGDYAFVWGAGSNTSLEPTYYTSGDAVRMYSGNTFTITALGDTPLTSIDIDITGSTSVLTSNVGTYDDTTGSWTGDATEVKFTASATRPHIVSIIINGYEGEPQVAQEVDIATAADADNKGTLYIISGTVSASCYAGYVLTDETGSIYIYGNDDSYVAGDVLTIEGETSVSSGIVQMKASESTITKDGSETVSLPEATAMSATAINALGTTSDVVYASFVGTLQESGDYVNVYIEGATRKLSINSTPDALYEASAVGTEVEVTGYIAGYTTSYLYVVATSVEVTGNAGVEEPDDDAASKYDSAVTFTADAMTASVDLSSVETFSNNSSTDAQKLDTTVTIGDITYTVDSSSCSNNPRYWWYSSIFEIRYYNGAIMTFSCPEGSVITNIEFDYTNSSYMNNLEFDSGEYTAGTVSTNGVWSGSAQSVDVTIVTVITDAYKEINNTYFSSITVAYQTAQ